MSDDSHAAGAFEWRDLAKKIAQRHGVTFGELMSRRKLKTFVSARWEVWEALRARGWSLPNIGMKWRMDHTSVLYGLRQRAAMRERGEIE